MIMYWGHFVYQEPINPLIHKTLGDANTTVLFFYDPISKKEARKILGPTLPDDRRYLQQFYTFFEMSRRGLTQVEIPKETIDDLFENGGKPKKTSKEIYDTLSTYL